jgi:protein O-GlcNAc transferase
LEFHITTAEKPASEYLEVFCYRNFSNRFSLGRMKSPTGDRPVVERNFMDLQSLQSAAESAAKPDLEFWLGRAIAALPPDERYCQIGLGHGGELIAALQAHSIAAAYAVADPDWVASHSELIESVTETLTVLNLQDQVMFCCQRFEEFFADWGATDSSEKIGVLLLNDLADYRSQLLTLLMGANFLADRAVILIRPGSLGSAQQAIGDFLLSHFAASILWESKDLWVLGWDRSSLGRTANLKQLPRSEAAIAAIQALQDDRQQQALKQIRDQALQFHFEYQYSQAAAKYQVCLSYDPNSAEIWRDLGMLHYIALQDNDAISALQKSLELDPAQATAHHVCGMSLQRSGRLEQAVGAFQAALQLNSTYADAIFQLGSLWLEQEDWTEAEHQFRQLIALHPEDCRGYLGWGDVLSGQSQPELAVAEYLKALQLKQRNPQILHKIGASYEEVGDLIRANNYFAYEHFRLHQYERASEYFHKFFELSRAEEVEADFEDYFNLHTSLYFYGQVQAAINWLRSATQFRPDDRFFACQPELILPPLYESETEITQARQRYLQALETVAAQYDRAIATGQSCNISSVKSITHFQLSYQGLNDRSILEIHGRLLHTEMARLYPQWVKSLTPQLRQPSEKIRVGYIAPSIGNNSATRWALGWLEQQDRSQFEIYCYNADSVSDNKTEQFKQVCDTFHQIPTLAAAGEQLRSDNLHILVFLALGSSDLMMSIAALRLAPVQCNTWGHPVTSGIPTVDYFLSGDLLEPPNAQEHYSEQLVRLPNLGISYPRPLFPPPNQTRADFGLPEDAVLYLSCQLVYKYLPQHDHLLVEIVRRVPKAHLVFVLRSTGSNSITEGLKQQFLHRLQGAFAQAGLNFENHYSLLPAQNWQSYPNLLHCMDAFLDTVDFSGGHTTFDAIACNLPVVTLPGELMRGRQSYGMLQMLGVTETIASSEAEYIDIAVRLGLEPEWRAAIVQQMHQNQSRLFNDKACVAGLEAFYRQVAPAEGTQYF